MALIHGHSFFELEVGRNLGKNIRPLIDPTVSRLAGLVSAILEILQIAIRDVSEVGPRSTRGASVGCP